MNRCKFLQRLSPAAQAATPASMAVPNAAVNEALSGKR